MSEFPAPICNACKKPLDKLGAVVLSPPHCGGSPSNVTKYHVCVKCWKRIFDIVQPEVAPLKSDPHAHPAVDVWPQG